MVRTEDIENIANRRQSESVTHPEFLQRLAVFVIVGQALFLASAWLLPTVSEFSVSGDYISELALGRNGFVQVASFFISGLGLLGLAYVYRKLSANSWGNHIGSALIAIYGVGAIVVAIFPTDRIDSAADIWRLSTSGMIHTITALIGSLSILLAIFILSWKFRKDARWRSLVLWSALLFGAALSLSFAQTEGPRVGLMQRFLATIISAWLIMTALRIRSIAATYKEDRQWKE